ncbi:MAG: PEP-CTERM sorting domain-containing protein [Akkermansiaceae bacterium]
MVNFRHALSVLNTFLITGQLTAATLAHSSNFEGSNKDGWQHPVFSGNQTSIQPDGPFNSILLVTSSGGGGVGSRLVVPNSTPNWTGNYSAAGITAVKMDLVNNSGLNLSIRIGVEGGAGGNRWTSIVPVSLSPSQRGTFRFDLDSSSLGAAGGNDLAAALADISQIRVLHNPNAGDFKGAAVPGSFTVDNITLVPEPSSSAMFFAACAILLIRRKR